MTDLLLHIIKYSFLLLQEGPFVYLSLAGTVARSNHAIAELCKCESNASNSVARKAV